MKQVLVPTSNVRRFNTAAAAVADHLYDNEIVGIGVVYGRPGLGKSRTADHYKSTTRREGVQAITIYSQRSWTEASMLKALLTGLGQEPQAYRCDVMLDQLIEALTVEPALFILDEAQEFAESRRQIAIIKGLHDLTNAAFLLLGETQLPHLLRRYEAFHNRLNRSAVVQFVEHSAADVSQIISQRCEVAVDGAVCNEIHRDYGRASLRSVIDWIRHMEAFARTNDCDRIKLAEYKRLKNTWPGNGKADAPIENETPAKAAPVRAAIGG